MLCAAPSGRSCDGHEPRCAGASDGAGSISEHIDEAFCGIGPDGSLGFEEFLRLYETFQLSLAPENAADGEITDRVM